MGIWSGWFRLGEWVVSSIFPSDQGQSIEGSFSSAQAGWTLCRVRLVTRGEMLPEIRQSVLLWVGCVRFCLPLSARAPVLISDEFQLQKHQSPKSGTLRLVPIEFV